MRSALIISITIHLLISLIALNWVSFRKVDYIPRQMYNVTLVSPAVAEPPKKMPEVAPEPEPAPPEPIEEEVEEEIPEPIKPKPTPPKPKPKPQEKKPVPKAELQKTPNPTEATESNEPAPETGGLTVDTEFPFAYYINTMRRKIAAQWRVPAGSQGEDRFCRVYFRVHRDGSVSNVAVEESSGLFMFDQAAQRAVMQSAPMAPLPREYRDSYLGVHFSFAYRETGQ